jgi:hypothetical protein
VKVLGETLEKHLELCPHKQALKRYISTQDVPDDIGSVKAFFVGIVRGFCMIFIPHTFFLKKFQWGLYDDRNGSEKVGETVQ